MSPPPTDDELENSAAERTEAIDDTSEELSNLGQNVDTAADLAGDTADHTYNLRGMFGALIDQDTDFFDYSSEALGNLNSAMRAHISSLTGLHGKVDRNRREVLMLAGGAALGYDWINASSEDEPGSGPFKLGGSDIDGYGTFFEQESGSASQPVKNEGYLDRDLLGIAEQETGSYFRTVFDEEQWSYGTDGEATDIAGIRVLQEGDEFRYELGTIDTEDVEGEEWLDTESWSSLIENYEDALTVEQGYINDENLGEYLIDLSDSETPEELDFETYLKN